ncbi:hypothetical protein Tco_0361434, partial [Tanacetum coccineum]
RNQCQNGFTKDEIFLMTFEHSSSSLGRQCQMVSAENNTSGPAPFLNDSNDVCSHQFRPRSPSMASAENNTSGPVPQCSYDV